MKAAQLKEVAPDASVADLRTQLSSAERIAGNAVERRRLALLADDPEKAARAQSDIDAARYQRDRLRVLLEEAQKRDEGSALLTEQAGQARQDAHSRSVFAKQADAALKLELAIGVVVTAYQDFLAIEEKARSERVLNGRLGGTGVLFNVDNEVQKQLRRASLPGRLFPGSAESDRYVTGDAPSLSAFFRNIAAQVDAELRG